METSRSSWWINFVRVSQVLALIWSQLLIPSEAQHHRSDLDQWGEWSVWSSCSSTCGPGLATRTRRCGTDSSDRRLSCTGSSIQKKVCEIRPCPSYEPTAHEVACSRYNSRVFSGRRYVWEPFTHPPSPCKLACRARGKHFYANLAGRVQDGTPCGRGSAEAVCDGGACRRVGCDGVIASSQTRDNCGVCQGDGSSCKSISSVFTSTSLRRGLNDVISFPEGSTNINISELEPSRNLLLLQTFEGRMILNGGTRSPGGGKISAAGTTFTYSSKSRFNTRQTIFAPGPINVGIKLKLLFRGNNPGIEYTFNVPTNKSETSLRQINHVSEPVRFPDNDLRDRMGVSSFEAGPGQSSRYDQRGRTSPSASSETSLGVESDSTEETIDFSESEDSDSEGDDALSSSEEIESSEEDEDSGSLDSGSQSTGDDDQEDEDLGSPSDEEDYEEKDGEDETDDGEEEDVDDEDEDDTEDEEGSEESEEVEETETDVSRSRRYRTQYIQNTLSDEQFRPSSDDDYRRPRYSQSFTYGNKYKGTRGDISSAQVRNQGSQPRAYGDTKRSGRVVSFGLQYVDDKNGNVNGQGQTVTVGNSRYVPSTYPPQQTYTPRHSGKRHRQGGSRGRYQGGSQYYPRAQRRTQRQNSDSQSADRRLREDRRRQEYIRQQRQREAQIEERRRRAQQERERYNQRLKEYNERARRRQAQIAEQRRRERERYEAYYQRRRQNAASQDRARSNRRQPSVPERERPRETSSRESESTVPQQRPNEPKDTASVIRPYGEDGLYASGQHAKSTESPPDSVEIFRRPGGDRDDRAPNRPRGSTYGGVATVENPSGQPRIISRVSKPDIIPRVAKPAPESPPKIISRLAKPVEQAKPDIIPRVRAAGPLDNTGGRRPSSVSALSGGADPVQKTKELTNNVIPNGSPLRPGENVDRIIEAGRVPDDTAYTWRISGFSACTMTCGGGIQQTVVVCVDTTTQAVVTDENCRHIRKPDLTAVKCNKRPCPAEWSPSPWSDCSASCGGGERTRTLTCQSRVSPTLNITVDDSSCQDKERPPRRERCGMDPCNSWRLGNWSQCSARCGEGVRTRPVECVSLAGEVLTDDSCSSSVKPQPEMNCDNGPCGKGWFYQDWPEECPVECGGGEMTRKIFCSGESNEVLPHERCDPDQRPDTSRKCRSSRPCGGQWFTGPWSKCAAQCGKGQRTRDVICIKSLSGSIFATVDEENCLASDKPAHSEPCERQACAPEWYMTSWSECSKSCDTGYKSRGVKCLSPEQTPSNQCPLSARPTTRDACNTQSCNKITTNETSGPEPSSECEDRMAVCRVVKRARLCRFRLYKEKCCKSCSKE